jgi:hypothetical protein
MEKSIKSQLVSFSLKQNRRANAGVVGFACAKLTPLEAKLVKAISKNFIMFFTASPPSLY